MGNDSAIYSCHNKSLEDLTDEFIKEAKKAEDPVKRVYGEGQSDYYEVYSEYGDYGYGVYHNPCCDSPFAFKRIKIDGEDYIFQITNYHADESLFFFRPRDPVITIRKSGFFAALSAMIDKDWNAIIGTRDFVTQALQAVGCRGDF